MVSVTVDARKEIVDACLRLINDEINLIEGCRKLIFLRNYFDLEEDPCFLPFVGVVSETDDYPVQSVRARFSGDYLSQLDREVGQYVSQVRPSIIEACELLVAKYG